jgi:hypothetical protein
MRFTAPAKPFRPGVIVIVETAEKPALTVSTDGLAATEKSCFVKVTIAVCDNDPLEPVTVTEKVPTKEGVHVRVEVPEPPLTLAGMSVHVSPATGADVRETVPPKLFSGLTMIVEEPDVPVLTGTLVGFATSVKSWVANVTVVTWESEPLVPVTVTTFVVAAGKVQDRVAVPDPETLDGDNVQAALLADKPTAPLNPLRGVTVIVDVAAPPLEVTEVGLALIAKSTTWKVEMAE